MDTSFETLPLAEITSPVDPEQCRPVVLVVDDEVLIADTLSIILSNSHYVAITAYSGKSALEIARVIPPDLLLSDVAMPGMTGVELAITMIHLIDDCKVLLVSGQSATTDLLGEARNAGYDFPLLNKPIHPRLLLERLSSCLEDISPLSDSRITGEIALSEEDSVSRPTEAATRVRSRIARNASAWTANLYSHSIVPGGFDVMS